MPDLKSELFKVAAQVSAKKVAESKDPSLDNLTFDDDDSPTPSSQLADSQAVKLTNASLVAYVEAHPSCTYTDIHNAFPGFSSGVGARLKQLTDRGILGRTKVGGFYQYKRTSTPFVPLTSEERVRLMNEARAAKGKSKAKKKKAAPKTITLIVPKKQATRPAAPDPVKAQWDVTTIIDSLGLKQAKALYDELKKFFG